MSVIRTKFLPTTANRPSRVKAWACWNPRKHVTVGVHSVDGDAHCRAVEELIRKLSADAKKVGQTDPHWAATCVWVIGWLDRQGCVAVNVMTDPRPSGVYAS